MLPLSHLGVLKIGAACAVLAASLLAAPFARAQERSAAPPTLGGSSEGDGASNAVSLDTGAADAGAGDGGVARYMGTLIPGFRFTANIDLSEAYDTNTFGGTVAANSSQSDWITMAGLRLGMNEHSARVSLDASYAGNINYYAQGSQATQFTNYLQALAEVSVIPDYVRFIGRAFAQPVVLTSLGAVSANGYATPNNYSNSYGFSAGPDITFRLGDFASSDFNASYGATYFTSPEGVSAFPVIPGVLGAENTVVRSFSERLSSGTFFSRLNWVGLAVFQELDRQQSLFSEKAATGHFAYAITRQISVLATGGYDAVSNSTKLNGNLSGPIATGGIGLTFNENFSLQFEVGEKYNSPSYQGFVRYSLSPTAILTGSLTDSVSTPEGQLLNGLSGLSATSGGALISGANLYSNGTGASLAGFNAQPAGGLAFNQAISRYQQANLDFSQDVERNHYHVGLYATKQTVLDAVFVGQRENNSWGTRATFGHDITRQMTGTIGAGYTTDQELGGHAHTYNISGDLSYLLSPSTSVYFRTDYISRESSASLQALSPFTGSLQDIRVTLGLNHAL